MVEVLKISDVNVIKSTYAAKNIEYKIGDMLINATENGDIIGQALFYADTEKIVLHYLEPKEDILLLDGLIRSVLHYASENCIKEAYFEKTAPIDKLQKLGFIEDLDKKSLKMLGLIGSCENCKNK